MGSSRIVGREYEISLIEECYSSDRPEFVALYGRRRVGKTYLVKETLGERIDFSFSGIYKASRADLLLQFRYRLEETTGRTYKKFSSWFEAFNALSKYLESLQKDRLVVFLDELPWLDTQKSMFLPALSNFWNSWGCAHDSFKLYVCGSATSWMLDKLIGDKGGLYGRLTRPIYLAPFTLKETFEYFRVMKGVELGLQQVLDIYMIFGGIPYYLDLVDTALPVSVSVDRLFFTQGGALRTEFLFLFRTLFNEAASYRKVVGILSRKMSGMTRNEIIAEDKSLGGGVLSSVLEDLCSCDFVRRYKAFGKTEKDAIYQLTDLFSLFYLRFVDGYSGQNPSFWTLQVNSGVQDSWKGYAFEMVCLHHLEQIRHALGIHGVINDACSLSVKPFVDKEGTAWKGGQFDLILDRGDRVINLCEIKYSNDAYVISGDYEQRLRERTSMFKVISRVNKTVLTTFITPYGVKPNIHSGIVSSEVRLKDLFQ